MKGFFTRKELKTDASINGRSHTCVSCGMYKAAFNPKMEPQGNFKKKILVVGMAPSRREDKANSYWMESSGRYLRDTLLDFGVDLHEDCLSTNAVNCLSVNENGNECYPTSHAISCCRHVKLLPIINEYKPKMILLLGKHALESIIGYRWHGSLDNMNKWRGFTIPDRHFNAWLCPVDSPIFVVEEDKEEVRTIFRQDIQRALSKVNEPFPKYGSDNMADRVIIVNDFSKLPKNPSYVSFDYETTGIKPQAKGHRILTMAFGFDDEKAYACCTPQTRNEMSVFLDWLENPNIKKWAHNMAYEDIWTKVRFRKIIKNWDWDSMIAAHVLDNRPYITSLKLQGYLYFGIDDYDSEIKPHMKLLDEADGNSLNRMPELMNDPVWRNKVLTYNGSDVLVQTWLTIQQRREMELVDTFQEAYQLLHNGVLAFARATHQGFRIDMDYCQRVQDMLTNDIKNLEDQFYESSLYKTWKATFQGKTNIESSQQLAYVLYSVLKHKPQKYTPSGIGSTDESALEALNIPELELRLSAKKKKKVRDTYLSNFIREQCNGYIHTSYNLHIVRTYRSSSSNPNLQNVPKHDKESQKICRSAVFPRIGHRLLGADYSGIEVRIAGSLTGDEKLQYDILHGDMHGDMAVEIYKLESLDKRHPGENVLRQGSKNSFVFPEFYGDYYKNCAPQLLNWAENATLRDDTPALVHLADKGLVRLDKKGRVVNYDKFLDHLQAIEDDFWNVRYKTYTKWKDKIWAKYQKTGYVELPTGFRCGEVMSRNEVLNRPIQGAAFHCLLWSFIQIDRISIDENWDTKLVGQIHDEILLDVNNEELENGLGKVVKRVMTQDILEHWPWITVPLEVEADITPIDGSWYEFEYYEL